MLLRGTRKKAFQFEKCIQNHKQRDLNLRNLALTKKSYLEGKDGRNYYRFEALRNPGDNTQSGDGNQRLPVQTLKPYRRALI